MTTSDRRSVMSRFSRIVLFAAIAALIAPPATRADEPPADDMTPAEAVLGDAGLTRISTSYIAQEEIWANDLGGENKRLEAEVMMRMRKYRELEGRYNSKKAEASRLRSEAIQYRSEYDSETKSYKNKETYR